MAFAFPITTGVLIVSGRCHSSVQGLAQGTPGHSDRAAQHWPCVSGGTAQWRDSCSRRCPIWSQKRPHGPRHCRCRP